MSCNLERLLDMDCYSEQQSELYKCDNFMGHKLGVVTLEWKCQAFEGGTRNVKMRGDYF